MEALAAAATTDEEDATAEEDDGAIGYRGVRQTTTQTVEEGRDVDVRCGGGRRGGRRRWVL